MISMAQLIFMLGGVLGVAIVARILLFISKKWASHKYRFTACYILTLLIVASLASLGMAEQIPEGYSPFAVALQSYLMPWLVCFSYDSYARLKKVTK